MRFKRRAFFAVMLVATTIVFASCGHKVAQNDGYKPAAVPGVTRARLEAVLGKPQQDGPFSLPGVEAEVLTYPFGQVLVRNGTVVAISINNDPQFSGPFGVSWGMTEEALKTAFAAHPGKRSGHKDSYDAIEKSNDTRTRDIFDTTDHMMVELTAANANDPLAPFYVAQVTLANDAGLRLLDAFTKARVNGLYPDVHVDNFVSVPWP